MIQSCERVSLDLAPKGSATLTKPFCGGGFSCPSDCCSVVAVVVVGLELAIDPPPTPGAILSTMIF